MNKLEDMPKEMVEKDSVLGAELKLAESKLKLALAKDDIKAACIAFRDCLSVNKECAKHLRQVLGFLDPDNETEQN